MKKDLIEGCLGGVFLGLVVILFMFMMLMGCATTCPPPKAQVVKEEVPVYSCPEPPDLPALDLPWFPVPPAPDASHEAIKEWYSQMVSVTKQREKLLLARVEALQEILKQYQATH